MVVGVGGLVVWSGLVRLLEVAGLGCTHIYKLIFKIYLYNTLTVSNTNNQY